MCAGKSEGASYGVEALAPGGLTEAGLLLGTNRTSGDVCNSVAIGVKQISPGRRPKLESGPLADTGLSLNDR
jgi:hypothetical protein